MREGMKVTAENLNEVMEFDHVIEVHEDGTVTDSEESPYFELYYLLADAETGLWEFHSSLPEGWELMTGYTGQYGYNGPCMHASEFIGGRMARDILETPGLYVVLIVESDCGLTEEYCNAEDGCQCEPESWAVAHKPAE
jgi:hypothetical protein